MSSRNDSEEEVWGDILDEDEEEDEEDKEMKQPDEEGGNEEEEMLQEEEEKEEEEKVLVDANNIPGFMTSSSPCSSGVRRDPREAEASVGVGVGVGGGRVCKGVLCLGFVVRVNWKGY
ncbi:hypothetical protein Pmani_035366 [Petrolisthes manimaculis]|uniref:Uncharacterized protein n=1 Tax=Petrolisthes manimaculis TaxID=1843537 RepID=A0AAE1TN99_9EUCA|nr:hypothetical protein Pmani_035366 [Petrolisthes manimaculis]